MNISPKVSIPAVLLLVAAVVTWLATGDEALLAAILGADVAGAIAAFVAPPTLEGGKDVDQAEVEAYARRAKGRS